MGEIFKAVAAESEPLGFEDRYLYGRMKSARHGSSLSRHLRSNVWNRNRANTQPMCATAQGWKLPAENVGNLGGIRLLVQNCRYIDAAPCLGNGAIQRYVFTSGVIHGGKQG